MKVIIIGAGLSGLSTAIALRKYITTTPLELTIIDKPVFEPKNAGEGSQTRQRRRKLGAAISLQSNGIRVLEDLDPALKQRVYDAGWPCDHFKWKTENGTLLGREYIDCLPVSRPILIDCLMVFLPKDCFVYRTVKEVVIGGGKRPVVRFEDGGEEVADLVVGADGVRSVVRHAMFGDDKKYKPEYVGICGVGGILDVPLSKKLTEDPSIDFLSGSTGVFGYCGLSRSEPNKLLYFSFYETPLPERGQKIDHAAMVKSLRERHAHWPDPLIQQCLEKADLDNIYPITVMPELPRWGQDGCILVGDAAHAMPPRSGQGGSQAFEDGQSLGLILAANLKKHEVSRAVSESVDDFYQVRHARVDNIRWWATAWKDPKMPMSWWKTYLLWTFLYVSLKLRALTSMFASVNDWNAKVEVEKYLARK